MKDAPKAGRHPGALGRRWLGERPAGVPTSDEHAGTTPYRSAGDWQSDFAHGSIYYDHVNAVTNSHGPRPGDGPPCQRTESGPIG